MQWLITIWPCLNYSYTSITQYFGQKFQNFIFRFFSKDKHKNFAAKPINVYITCSFILGHLHLRHSWHEKRLAVPFYCALFFYLLSGYSAQWCHLQPHGSNHVDVKGTWHDISPLPPSSFLNFRLCISNCSGRPKLNLNKKALPKPQNMELRYFGRQKA